MRATAIGFAILAAFLLAAGSALAMTSASYTLEWLTPGTGSGGSASSTNYAASFTAGQTSVGAAASASYRAELGYWVAIRPGHLVFLPVAAKNYQ